MAAQGGFGAALKILLSLNYRGEQINRAISDLSRYRKSQIELARTAAQAGQATDMMRAKIDAAGRAAQTSALRLRGLASASTARGFTTLTSLASRAASIIGTIGIGITLGRAIRVLNDFGKEMSALRAVTGATDAQMRIFEDTARRLGTTTLFPAAEVADGMKKLAQAGFSANETIEAISGTLALATAGEIDLERATSITASAIRGFGLDASEASNVADVLAVVAAKSNTTIGELGEGMKFVAASARNAGVSFNETISALGALSDAGLRGTIAGTGLNRVLIGLINVTQQGERAIGRLGLSLRDVDPRIVSVEHRGEALTTIIDKFVKAGLGASEAFDLFGVRGGPAALTLVLLHEKFQELNEAAGAAEGAAQRMADVMADNLYGDLRKVNAAISELLISAGPLNDALRAAAQFTRDLALAMAGASDPTSRFYIEAVKIRNAIYEVANGLKIMIPLVGGLLIFSRLALAAFSFAKAMRTLYLALVAFNTAGIVTGRVLTGIGIGLTRVIGGLPGLALSLGAGVVAWLAFKEATKETSQVLADEAVSSLERTKRVLDEFSQLNKEDVQVRVSGLGKVDNEITQILKESIPVQNARTEYLNQINSLEARGLELEKERAAVTAGEALKSFKSYDDLYNAISTNTEATAAFKIGLQQLDNQLSETGKRIQDVQKQPDILAARIQKFQIEQTKDQLVKFNEELRDLLNISSAAGGEGLEKTYEKIGGIAKRAKVTAPLIQELSDKLRGLNDSRITSVDIKAKQENVDLFEQYGLSDFDLKNKQEALEKLRAKAAEFTGALDTARVAQGNAIDPSYVRQQELLIESAGVLADKLQLQINHWQQTKLDLADVVELTVKQKAAQAELATLENKHAAAQKELDNTLEKANQKVQRQNDLLGVNAKQHKSVETALELLDKLVRQGYGDFARLSEAVFELYQKEESVRIKTDELNKTFSEGFRRAADDFIEAATDAGEQGERAFTTFFDGATEQLTEFIVTGKGSFKEFSESIQKEIVGTVIKFEIAQVLKQFGIEKSPQERQGPEILSEALARSEAQVRENNGSLGKAQRAVDEANELARQMQPTIDRLAGTIDDSIVATRNLTTTNAQLDGSLKQLSSALGIPTDQSLVPQGTLPKFNAENVPPTDVVTGKNVAGRPPEGFNFPDSIKVDPLDVPGLETLAADVSENSSAISANTAQLSSVGASLTQLQSIQPAVATPAPIADPATVTIDAPIPNWSEMIAAIQNIPTELLNGLPGILGPNVTAPITGRLDTLIQTVSGLETKQAATANAPAPSSGTGFGGGGAVGGGGAQSTGQTPQWLQSLGNAVGTTRSVLGLITGFLQFEKGGVTPGMRGGAEIPAILHPNEAVIPLNLDRRLPLDVRNGKLVVPLPGANRFVKLDAPKLQNGETNTAKLFDVYNSLSSSGFNVGAEASLGDTTKFGAFTQTTPAPPAAGYNFSGAFQGVLAVAGLALQILSFLDAQKTPKHPKISVTPPRKGLGLIAGEAPPIGPGKLPSLASYTPPSIQDLENALGQGLNTGSFASGGVVTSPTLSMLGEGGVPEAIIPMPGGRVPVQMIGRGTEEPKAIVSNVTINVTTQDANSFRAAQGQIAARMAAANQRALSRNS